MTLTIEQIKELCLAFDKLHNTYPESEFEGRSVYVFICQSLNKEPDIKEWREA